MKRIARTTMYLPIAAMSLAGVFAFPAMAQQPVPFKGTFQGSDTVTFPTLTQSITGTGTQLGQFSAATFLRLTRSGGTGTSRWTAANGDSIDTSVVGAPERVPMAACQVEGAQADDTYDKVTEIHLITGGTGRFAGVQGSFTMTLYHDVVPRSDGTHGTCGSYSGTLTPPGATH